jgi:hypothetical protein
LSLFRSSLTNFGGSGHWADAAHVRRVELDLVEEYQDMLRHVLAMLTPENHDLAVQIADLPDGSIPRLRDPLRG